MDDLFFILKKIFRRKFFQWLAISVVTAAVLYGIFTWDSRKAVNFYFKLVEFITKPITNRALKKLNRTTGQVVPVQTDIKNLNEN